MMQVTPMWMPMTMPVVDVWLLGSSFRQSHGGLRATGRGREGAVALWPEAPVDTQASGGASFLSCTCLHVYIPFALGNPAQLFLGLFTSY